ncbi:DNA (cytosine-5)-methyltransferase CMT2 [Dendrobium catenatum]|uniref:DNA (Cytosine-5)-methyltransferase CMT2 n=1 Tax=Dendrobium catenatum TaxID=906689 RepID=A0A2I0X1V5_9ASPA|nr:DNA (cytosine-5)-methyltransferase CMT2 [Dendrobium catenatum]
MDCKLSFFRQQFERSPVGGKARESCRSSWTAVLGSRIFGELVEFENVIEKNKGWREFATKGRNDRGKIRKKAEKGRPDYVGRILEFFKTTKGENYFTVQWFFRADDTRSSLCEMGFEKLGNGKERRRGTRSLLRRKQVDSYRVKAQEGGHQLAKELSVHQLVAIGVECEHMDLNDECAVIIGSIVDMEGLLAEEQTMTRKEHN